MHTPEKILLELATTTMCWFHRSVNELVPWGPAGLENKQHLGLRLSMRSRISDSATINYWYEAMFPGYLPEVHARRPDTISFSSFIIYNRGCSLETSNVKMHDRSCTTQSFPKFHHRKIPSMSNPWFYTGVFAHIYR